MTTALEQAALNSTPIIPTLDAEVPDLAKASQNKGVWPKFHMKPVYNKAKSEELGRPVHDEVEWVTVIIAGDRNSQPSHKVSDLDRQKWPTEYQAFKSGSKMPVQGTRLSDWGQLSTSQVADLESMGILTVEMLAGLSDEQVKNYGLGGVQLREKAQGYIEHSKDQAVPQQLYSENARMKEDIADKDRQIETLKEALNKASDNPESTERVEQLSTMVKMLESQNTALEDSNVMLKDKIETLEQKTNELTMVNGQQAAEIEKLSKKPAPAKKAAAKKPAAKAQSAD